MTDTTKDPPRQCWQTPPELKRPIWEEFSPNIDVTANATNALCEHFIDIEEDARYSPTSWKHEGKPSVAWCNPPHARMMPWVGEMLGRIHDGDIETGLLLTPASTASLWWEYGVQMAYEVRLLSPRVSFLPPPGIEGDNPMGDNALFIFRKTPEGWPGARILTWKWKDGRLI